MYGRESKSLCEILLWESGDYTAQNLHQPTYTKRGRSIHINDPAYVKETQELWIIGTVEPGDGKTSQETVEQAVVTAETAVATAE